MQRRRGDHCRGEHQKMGRARLRKECSKGESPLGAVSHAKKQIQERFFVQAEGQQKHFKVSQEGSNATIEGTAVGAERTEKSSKIDVQ